MIVTTTRELKMGNDRYRIVVAEGTYQRGDHITVEIDGKQHRAVVMTDGGAWAVAGWRSNGQVRSADQDHSAQ